MIRFTLSCPQDHRFDSWFASNEAFDALDKAGQLSCAVCGSDKVSKAMMAPAVNPERALSAPANTAEQAIAELREMVERESEYVGMQFATEARAMHDGDMPNRSIYGEARPDEARALIADGVPVAPLPFRPRKRAH